MYTTLEREQSLHDPLRGSFILHASQCRLLSDNLRKKEINEIRSFVKYKSFTKHNKTFGFVSHHLNMSDSIVAFINELYKVRIILPVYILVKDSLLKK